MAIFNMIGGGGGSGLELIEEGTYTQQYNATSLTIPINTNIKSYGTDDGIFYVEAEPVSPLEDATSVIKCYGLVMGSFRDSVYYATMCLYGKYQSAYGSYLNGMNTGSRRSNEIYFFVSNSKYFYSGNWTYKIYKIKLP